MLMLKSVSLLKIKNDIFNKERLESLFSEYLYQPPSAMQMSRSGFSSISPLVESEGLVFDINGGLFFNYIEGKRSVSKKEIDKAYESYLITNNLVGRSMTKQEKKEIIDALKEDLLESSIVKEKSVPLLFLKKEQLILIGSTKNDVVGDFLFLLKTIFEHAGEDIRESVFLIDPQEAEGVVPDWFLGASEMPEDLLFYTKLKLKRDDETINYVHFDNADKKVSGYIKEGYVIKNADFKFKTNCAFSVDFAKRHFNISGVNLLKEYEDDVATFKFVQKEGVSPAELLNLSLSFTVKFYKENAEIIKEKFTDIIL